MPKKGVCKVFYVTVLPLSFYEIDFKLSLSDKGRTTFSDIRSLLEIVFL